MHLKFTSEKVIQFFVDFFIKYNHIKKTRIRLYDNERQRKRNYSDIKNENLAVFKKTKKNIAKRNIINVRL